MAVYNKEIEKNLNQIVDLKKQWQQTEDTNLRNKIANNARQYYDNLVGLGRCDIADTLGSSNYEQAVNYQNTMKKSGKTAFRPYMYSLGKNAGLSQSDVDALVSWDNDTKEITFGGKKIGVPDEIVDGQSYFSDTKALDDAFSDYQDRTGSYNDEAYISQKTRDNVDWIEGNPFESDVGKELMGGVKGEMATAGNNALASSASTSSGNIDSFAAANAQRQKEAVLNSRKQTVLDYYQNRANLINDTLDRLGVHQTRRASIDIENKNAETERLAQKASVTGYVPNEWANDYNPFLDRDGNVKSEYLTDEFDSQGGFQAIIDKAKAEGNNDLAQYARIARGAKIFGDVTGTGKWLKYANEGEYDFAKPQRTAEYDLTQAGYDTQRDIANTEALASNYAADMDYQKGIDVANANGIYGMEKQNLANEGNANVQYIKNAGNLAVQQSKNSSSGKSSSGSSSSSSALKEAKATIKSFVDAFNSTESKKVILIDGSGEPYFNPALSEKEKEEYISKVASQLYNTSAIDDDLKQIMIQDLTPYSGINK